MDVDYRNLITVQSVQFTSTQMIVFHHKNYSLYMVHTILQCRPSVLHTSYCLQMSHTVLVCHMSHYTVHITNDEMV